MVKKISNKVLLLIICLIPINAFLWNYLFTNKSFISITEKSNGFITPTLIAGISSVLLFLIISMKLGRIKLKDFLLNTNKIKTGLFWALILWVLLNLSSAIFSFFQNGSITFSDKLNYKFGSFSAQFLGSALAEELVYRGIILTQIYLILKIKFNNKLSIFGALILSQLLFSLSHLPNRIILGQTEYLFLDLIKLFIAGIILSLMFIKTQNLVYLVGVHSFLNYPFCLFKTDLSFPILISLLFALIVTIFWNKINGSNKINWFKEGLNEKIT
ncbi:MAG: CPBP family intramembrane metalloprotease [Tenacibaculum sp.]|nr:CPBP family intramembrane metalloprotease [Tenacibaculum sp.]